MTAPTSTRYEEPLWWRVLWHPATMAPVAVITLGYYCHWTIRSQAIGSVIAWVAAGVVVGWLRHLSHAPRLTRAMAQVGLVRRRSGQADLVPHLVRRTAGRGRNYTAQWELPSGVTLRDVQAKREALEEHCNVGLRFWFADGFLHGEVLRHSIPRKVDFERFSENVHPSDGALIIGIGEGKRGPIVVDLAVLPHLLVGGQTGGGKSVFLRQMLTGLLRTHEPDELNLALIDLKGGLELHRFASMPHSLAPVADSIESASALLDRVREELDRRLRLLREAGASDIQT